MNKIDEQIKLMNEQLNTLLILRNANDIKAYLKSMATAILKTQHLFKENDEAFIDIKKDFDALSDFVDENSEDLLDKVSEKIKALQNTIESDKKALISSVDKKLSILPYFVKEKEFNAEIQAIKDELSKPIEIQSIEIDVIDGFLCSKENGEWKQLIDLKEIKGRDGKDGVNGAKGGQGQSAFSLAQEGGYPYDEDTFIKSLVTTGSLKFETPPAEPDENIYYIYPYEVS